MERSPAAVEVRKDETTRLYEALIDGRVVGNLAYETTGGQISLTHSYVDQDHRHQGIASALARYALEDLSAHQAKVGIFCGFVADYVRDHPEWNDAVDISRSTFIATRTARDTNRGADTMNDLHVTIEPERIVTSTLLLRPWSVEDAEAAFEIYGDSRTAESIGRRRPVRDLAEMRELLEHWNLQSSQSPLPQGLWAVEAADDGQLLGGATLLPFSPRDPQLVMGWHLRPQTRGRGVAGRIGHALAHQAFLASDVEEVFVAAPAHNAGSLAVAKRLGMTAVDTFSWTHHGVRLEVLRMSRGDLHRVRPGISMDSSYDPEGLDDW